MPPSQETTFFKVQNEIQKERRTVSFDTYDITVKQLIDMVNEHNINVSPDYQRHFVWKGDRQSKLIESIFLGIPVPNIFMATNLDSSWEVIDGLQRVTTIMNYASEDSEEELKLCGLEKVSSLNGMTFNDLTPNLKLNFLTRPIRITVLNDQSDYQVRFDLFERLNTGGITLHPQEIRNCVYQGGFSAFIKNCADDEKFKKSFKKTNRQGRGNTEELVLKFFAYFEDRNLFKHSVKDFLNDYMDRKTNTFKNEKELTKLFDDTFSTINRILPNGIVRSNRPNSTPLVLFEAITVGVADIIHKGKEIDEHSLSSLLDDKELEKLTTGATNSNNKLLSRINLVSERAAK